MLENASRVHTSFLKKNKTMHKNYLWTLVFTIKSLQLNTNRNRTYQKGHSVTSLQLGGLSVTNLLHWGTQELPGERTHPGEPRVWQGPHSCADGPSEEAGPPSSPVSGHRAGN